MTLVNYVPCLLLCLTWHMYYMLSCLAHSRALRAPVFQVLCALRVLMLNIPTVPLALVPHLPRALCTLVSHVPLALHALEPAFLLFIPYFFQVSHVQHTSSISFLVVLVTRTSLIFGVFRVLFQPGLQLITLMCNF